MSERTIENIELAELEGGGGTKKLINSPALEVIRDVPLQLTAVLGGATLTVGELFGLTENSVLKLDTLVDEPLELMLDNRVVARGILVVADDNFGVQISEVIHEE